MLHNARRFTGEKAPVICPSLCFIFAYNRMTAVLWLEKKCFSVNHTRHFCDEAFGIILFGASGHRGKVFAIRDLLESWQLLLSRLQYLAKPFAVYLWFD